VWQRRRRRRRREEEDSGDNSNAGMREESSTSLEHSYAVTSPWCNLLRMRAAQIMVNAVVCGVVVCSMAGSVADAVLVLYVAVCVMCGRQHTMCMQCVCVCGLHLVRDQVPPSH
jgi:hypothetical protein